MTLGSHMATVYYEPEEELKVQENEADARVDGVIM